LGLVVFGRREPDQSSVMWSNRHTEILGENTQVSPSPHIPHEHLFSGLQSQFRPLDSPYGYRECQHSQDQRRSLHQQEGHHRLAIHQSAMPAPQVTDRRVRCNSWIWQLMPRATTDQCSCLDQLQGSHRCAMSNVGCSTDKCQRSPWSCEENGRNLSLSKLVAHQCSVLPSLESHLWSASTVGACHLHCMEVQQPRT